MAVEFFNLQALPRFRGLDPHLPVTMYQRHLPHWRQVGATYFVTFRLADALPQEKVRLLKRMRETWEREHPHPRSEREWEEYAQEVMERTDAWLDEGFGECHFRRPQFATLLTQALLHFQNQRHETLCYCVMPNHCHVVVRPLDDFALEDLLNSWKGFVGHQINRQLRRSGPVWQDESYDRIVLDEEHLYNVIQYVGNNPARAGLPRSQWWRWIHPHWETAGWGFRDL